MARLRRIARIFILLGCVAMLAVPLTVGVAPVGAEPGLDLSPWRGPCTTKVVARGTGFAPGLGLRFTAQFEGTASDRAVTFAEATIGPDGAFEVTADLARLIPDCAAGTVPTGRQYRLSARDATTDSLLAYALFTIAPPEQTPALALDPPGGPCADPSPLVLVRGTGFPVDLSITLEVRDGTGTTLATFPGGSVAVGGTFAAGIRLIDCGPATPVGTRYTIIAIGGEPALNLATATYVTAPVGADALCFAETNQCVAGRFRARWQATGGLAINGYPLSEEFKQRLEDDKEYTVQYFERVRFEYHPENAAPQDIQLGQFGRRIVGTVTGAPTAMVSPSAESVHFRETGHNVSPDLFAFWAANGGLNQFGYPLTEEFSQTLEDGKTYIVQYFERARFERHPENAAPSTILLGQFGRRVLSETRR